MKDERIEKAWQEALSILKPTTKELEHGLALHADAFVCESYGFAPRSAVDQEVIRQALEEGASAMELQDLSEDMSMTRHVTDVHERERYIEAWKVSRGELHLKTPGKNCRIPCRS